MWENIAVISSTSAHSKQTQKSACLSTMHSLMHKNMLCFCPSLLTSQKKSLGRITTANQIKAIWWSEQCHLVETRSKVVCFGTPLNINGVYFRNQLFMVLVQTGLANLREEQWGDKSWEGMGAGALLSCMDCVGLIDWENRRTTWMRRLL